MFSNVQKNDMHMFTLFVNDLTVQEQVKQKVCVCLIIVHIQCSTGCTALHANLLGSVHSLIFFNSLSIQPVVSFIGSVRSWFLENLFISKNQKMSTKGDVFPVRNSNVSLWYLIWYLIDCMTRWCFHRVSG